LNPLKSPQKVIIGNTIKYYFHKKANYYMNLSINIKSNIKINEDNRSRADVISINEAWQLLKGCIDCVSISTCKKHLYVTQGQ